MTLALAVHNGTDIVIGSDTLATITNMFTNEVTNTYDFRKIFPIGDHAALLLAGNFDTHTIKTFMSYFVHSKAGQGHDVDSLKDELWKDVCAVLHFDKGDAIEVIVAGFTKEGIPKLYCIGKDHKESKEYKPLSDFYESVGYKAPCVRARELMSGFDALETSDLAEATKNLIASCIAEFPDRLGGKPDVVILRAPSLT